MSKVGEWIKEIEIRSLQPSELHGWTLFCQESFSFKLNPPSYTYFLNHFVQDPYADINLIFIAIHSIDQEIISTIRLFPRQIYQRNHSNEYEYSINNDHKNHKSIVDIVGIGEVCTKEVYRRKGLSSKLLHHALTIASSLGYKYSFLHASEWIQPLYQRFGFVSHSVEYIRLNISILKLRQYMEYHKTNFESIKSFLVKDYILDIVRLNKKYQSSMSGSMVRSEDYVKRWIVNETSKCITVGQFHHRDDMDDDSNTSRSNTSRSNTSSSNTMNRIDGGLHSYLSIKRIEESVYRLVDASFDSSNDNYWNLFFLGLFQSISPSLTQSDIDTTAEVTTVTVTLPLKAIQSIAGFGKKKEKIEEKKMDASWLLENDTEFYPIVDFTLTVDHGWMIATIDSGNGIKQSIDSIPSLSFDMFWPIDSF